MRYLVILLFIVVIVLIKVFLLGFTNVKIPKDSYQLKAFFENTGGIKENAQVLMAGMEIGQIESIELDAVRHGVVMTLAILDKYQVPNDSVLKIAEKGMLGEMHLAFDFGESKVSYNSGDEIIGKAPVSLSDFMGSAGGTFANVGNEVHALAQSLNKIMGDDGVQSNLKNTIAELPVVIKSLRETVDSNKKNIADLLETYNKLGISAGVLVDGFNKEMKKIQEAKVMDDFAATMHQIRESTVELKPLLESGRKAMAGADGLGIELKNTASGMNILVQKLNKPGGTGGKLFNDGELYDNLNQLMIRTRALVDVLEENPSSLIFGKRNKKQVVHAKAVEKSKLNERSLVR